MRGWRGGWAAAALALLCGPGRAEEVLPDAVMRLLPAGFEVLGSGQAAVDGRTEYIVVLGRRGETRRPEDGRRAPARPLLVFERRGSGPVRRTGRNDTVADRADEGGQCDPFLDGGGVIAVSGRFFTVQNGVACGQHWTDYITFRFNKARNGWVFDNERDESWSLNPSNEPGAEALVRDGPPRVRRARPGRTVGLEAWRREP